MGSKNRHAHEFLPIVLAGRHAGQWYVEPFVGGANVIDKVPGLRLAGDTHPDLIVLLRAMAVGYEPPALVTEVDYSAAKNMPAGPLRSYIGFCLSYGGKWFGGYRRDRVGKRCYSTEALRNYKRQAPALSGVDIRNCSYDELDIPPRSIIYCDPPYAGTTKYASGAFDHAAFWSWCDAKVSEGHSVFVSEYTAPGGWECVWSKRVNNTLTKDTGSKQGIERLFCKRLD